MNRRFKAQIKNRPKTGSAQNSKKKRTKGKGLQKKQTQFYSEGQPTSINEKGIGLEKSSMIFRNILYAVFGVIGASFCLLDIRDEGMELDFLGFFRYSGALVGAVICVLCVVAIMNNTPKVTIK